MESEGSTMFSWYIEREYWASNVRVTYLRVQGTIVRDVFSSWESLLMVILGDVTCTNLNYYQQKRPTFKKLQFASKTLIKYTFIISVTEKLYFPQILLTF